MPAQTISQTQTIQTRLITENCRTCPFRDFCRSYFRDARGTRERLTVLAMFGCSRLMQRIIRNNPLIREDLELQAILDQIRQGKITEIRTLARKINERYQNIVLSARPRERPLPPSWGQEIEINPNYIDDFFRELTRRHLGGNYDGSGPWEFSIGPFSVSEFPIEFMVKTSTMWRYRDYHEEMGCHLHYRPYHDNINTWTSGILSKPENLKIYEKWSLAIKNAYILMALMPKLADSHGSKDFVAFRRTVDGWAKPRKPLYDLAYGDKKEFLYTLNDWVGRDYDMVTLNRHRKPVLTLEFRAFESYPIKAWAFIRILNRAVQKKKVLGRIVNFDKFKWWIYDIYNGVYMDYEIHLADIGIESKLARPEEKVTLREIGLRILDYLKMDRITRTIVEYVYKVNDITDHESFKQFLVDTKIF